MITPTIGRVVLFRREDSDQPAPASICYVHSDDKINIAGYDKNGNHFACNNVTLIQEGDAAFNQAYWMDYQKAQQFKADSAPPTENTKTGSLMDRGEGKDNVPVVPAGKLATPAKSATPAKPTLKS